MDFLRSHLSEVEDDPYAMALVTYALHQDKDMFVINGNVIQQPPKITKDAAKMLDKLELKAKSAFLPRVVKLTDCSMNE